MQIADWHCKYYAILLAITYFKHSTYLLHFYVSDHISITTCLRAKPLKTCLHDDFLNVHFLGHPVFRAVTYCMRKDRKFYPHKIFSYESSYKINVDNHKMLKTTKCLQHHVFPGHGHRQYKMQILCFWAKFFRWQWLFQLFLSFHLWTHIIKNTCTYQLFFLIGNYHWKFNNYIHWGDVAQW